MFSLNDNLNRGADLNRLLSSFVAGLAGSLLFYICGLIIGGSGVVGYEASVWGFWISGIGMLIFYDKL